MKTEGGSAAEGSGPSGRRSGGAASSSMAYAMKFLAPEAMAAAVIGKKGAAIAEMRQSCSARITLTEHGELYPATDCRILTIHANTQDAINEVIRQLLAKLGELAKGSTVPESILQDGEIRLRTLMPRAAVGGLIGKGGASIKQLRESSGAKVTISEVAGTGPSAEQTVSVSGAPEAMETVLFEVNRQIQQVSGETWFQTWAATSGTSYGGYSTANSMVLPPMAQMSSGGYNNSQGIDVMMRVASNLPPYVMEDARGFALSCVVPNRLVGGLIGRGGNGTKEVQMYTNTKISIRDIPGDSENRAMHIAGQLANTCAAYMMMMKRYLDAEQQSSSGGPAPR